jgi:zinc protease
VIQLVDSVFADLPSKAVGQPLPKPTLSYSGETLVTQQTIPQSVSLFYHPGLNTGDTNYMMLSLVSAIFGSDFTSRLMKEVREKNGLAYTVQSFLSLKKEAASLGGFVGSKNVKIGEALTRIKKEFSTLASFGVTEQELKDAKKAAIGSFVLRLSSTSAIAGQLLTYQEIDYPASYLNERSGKINAIRLNDVNAFIKDFFDPQKLTFYVVGNPVKDLTQ